MRLHCGCVAVPVNRFFDIISSCFAKSKNVVHSLEILGVSPGSKLCATFLNIAKYFKTLRCGCGAVSFIFSIYLKPVLYDWAFWRIPFQNVFQWQHIYFKTFENNQSTVLVEYKNVTERKAKPNQRGIWCYVVIRYNIVWIQTRHRVIWHQVQISKLFHIGQYFIETVGYAVNLKRE